MSDYRQKARSFAIIAHVDHGKTTMADTLVAMGRIISQQSAAHKRYLDSDKIEQQRGITILSAGITVQYNGYTYYIIDSPGHVDFSSEVAKGLRAVDGVILVVDAVEGLMPQGENVLRQALRQSARLILFVNKIDRMFTELRYDLPRIRECLKQLLRVLNQLITEVVGQEQEEKYRFDFRKGNVIVGSALYKYAVNPLVSTVTLTDIAEIYKKGTYETLPQLAPLPMILSETVNRVLPSPKVAQAYKFADKPAIYQPLVSCDPAGFVSAIITNIRYDEGTRLAYVRIFSGTLRKGADLYLDKETPTKVLRVCRMLGKNVKDTPEARAGQLCVIVLSARDIHLGATLSADPDLPLFDLVRYNAEPVLSISFKPVKQQDLSKLKQVVREYCIQDTTLRYSYEQQTKQHILSGIGRLQLDIILTRIQNERGIPLILETPGVIYRETIIGQSEQAEVTTSNKHNTMRLYVAPLPDAVVGLLKEYPNILKVQGYAQMLTDAGLDTRMVKRILYHEETSLFFNDTKGVQYMQQTAPNMILGFKKAIKYGPICNRPVVGLAVYLTDAKFHVDFVHRSPADIAPPVTRLIHDRMLQASPKVLEPYLRAQITVPTDKIGAVTGDITRRRGRIHDVDYTARQVCITAYAPIRECTDLGEALISSAEGKLSWHYSVSGYEYLPEHLVSKVK